MKTVWVSNSGDMVTALEIEIVGILGRNFSGKIPGAEDWALLRALEMEYVRLFREIRRKEPPILPTKRRCAFIRRVKELAAVKSAIAA
jgi:hypothetical protein